MGSGPPKVKGEKSSKYAKRDGNHLTLLGLGLLTLLSLLTILTLSTQPFVLSSRPNPKHEFFNSYLMFLAKNQMTEEILSGEKLKVSQNLRLW